jgi:hypothetical protein
MQPVRTPPLFLLPTALAFRNLPRLYSCPSSRLCAHTTPHVPGLTQVIAIDPFERGFRLTHRGAGCEAGRRVLTRPARSSAPSSEPFRQGLGPPRCHPPGGPMSAFAIGVSLEIQDSSSLAPMGVVIV